VFYTLIVAPMGLNLAWRRGPSVSSYVPNFTLIGATMSPLRGEKPQNRPLSNLNNRRFALRTMLPVKNLSQPIALKYELYDATKYLEFADYKFANSDIHVSTEVPI